MSNLLIALLGALVATVVAVSAGLVFVINSSKNAGRREAKLDDAVSKLAKIEINLEFITTHTHQIAQLQIEVARMNSDFKHLRRTGSNHDFDNEGEE